MNEGGSPNGFNCRCHVKRMMSWKDYSGDSMEDRWFEKDTEAESSAKKKGNG